MAKKTIEDTSPAPTGEVTQENSTTAPGAVVTTPAEDTAKQEQEAIKQAELEAQKLAEETANKEQEAAKQTELEAQKLSEENAKQEQEAAKQAELEAKRLAEENAKKEQEALKQAELEANRLAEEYANKELEVNARLINGYEYRGRKYNFTDNMPLKVNLDGQIMSQEEIMSNTDVLESMIDSKNIFIKEI